MKCKDWLKLTAFVMWWPTNSITTGQVKIGVDFMVVRLMISEKAERENMMR